MKLFQFLILSIFLLTSSMAMAHERARTQIPIDHLIEKYSEIHGTKFVLDPRVKAKVNIVGLDLEELSQTNLMDILLIHTFTALEKEGVVYILPISAADYLNSEFGNVWRSE